MKRLICLMLCVVLLASVFVLCSCDEPVSPTPPASGSGVTPPGGSVGGETNQNEGTGGDVGEPEDVKEPEKPTDDEKYDNSEDQDKEVIE